MNGVLLKSAAAGIGAFLLALAIGWTPFLLFLYAFISGLCILFLSELDDEEKIFWKGCLLGISGGLTCLAFLSLIPGAKFFFGVFLGYALTADYLWFYFLSEKKGGKNA